MNTTKLLSYYLALLRTPGIGPIRFNQLLQQGYDLEELFTAPPVQLPSSLKQALQTPDWHGVECDLAWAEQPRHHIIMISDPSYPELLKQIADPPPLLFIKGDLDLLNQPQLAIVGSRNPTANGREIAQQFAQHISETGLIVTSGMAIGIDAASHRGALMAKGKTIAVMGTSLDQVYPKQHRELAEQILSQGALVSEFPIGTPAQPENFPQRNRIISGLCVGTLVVEATPRSGSLITARFATEQGREVFAIPGSIHNPLTRGCHALIKQGAKLAETPADILDEIGTLLTHIKTYSHTTNGVSCYNAPLDEHYNKLLNCIGFEPTTTDSLVQRSGLSINTLSSMLLILEIKGLIAATAGGYLRVI